MKEFWLAILKNIITYVLMIIIVVVGGLSIVKQKFPPKWEDIRSAVDTIKTAYVSMINLRTQLGGLQGMSGAAPPPMATTPAQQQALLESITSDSKDAEMQTTLALLKAMSQQIPQSPTKNTVQVASDPEVKKYLLEIEKQNQQMIERMDKIQVYLAGLHQYLSQTVAHQKAHQSAVQSPPPNRNPSSQQITKPDVPPAAVQPTALPAQSAKK